MKNNHLGQNFDDFLKEENIEIKEDEIEKRLDYIKKLAIEDLYSIYTAYKKFGLLNKSEDEK